MGSSLFLWQRKKCLDPQTKQYFLFLQKVLIYQLAVKINISIVFNLTSKQISVCVLGIDSSLLCLLLLLFFFFTVQKGIWRIIMRDLNEDEAAFIGQLFRPIQHL